MGTQGCAGPRWVDSGLVFTSTIGTPLEPRNVLRQFKAHLKTAGLPDQRFHDLRHCAATMLIAEGLPISVVSEMLGHSLTSTTMDVYAHVLPIAQRHAADMMERLLG